MITEDRLQELEILGRQARPPVGTAEIMELVNVYRLLTEVTPWLYAAYDRSPQIPEAVAMLAKLPS